PALHPSDHVLLGQHLCHAVHQLLVTQPLVTGAGRIEGASNFVVFVLRTQEGPLHGVALARLAGLVLILMPHGECSSQCTARVSGCWLNPDVAIRSLTQNPSIGHTVERYSSGQTQELGSELTMNGTCEPQHHFLGHLLHGGRDIHFALGEWTL